MSYLTIAVIAVGAWCIINGILHDIFVLRSEYGKKYDRELLRLLMDGHVLITCGAIQIVSYMGILYGWNCNYKPACILCHDMALP